MFRPANSFTIAELDIWLDEYENKLGEKIDRVVVDYLNKFKKVKGSRTESDWDSERRLTDDLRALMIVKGKRGVTAAQTNRYGIFNKEGTATETVKYLLLRVYRK